MTDFLSFIRNPVYAGRFFKLPLKEFFILLFFYFLVVIPFGVLASVISDLLGIASKINQITLPRQFIYGILLAPVVEEIFFRLILVFNRRNILILSFATIAMAIYFVINENNIKLIFFSILFILTILVFILFDRCKIFFYKHFKSLFFIIAGSFALVHLGNYLGISLYRLLPALFIIIPQLVAGTILGYLRVKYGFIYAIGFHATINLTLLFQL